MSSSSTGEATNTRRPATTRRSGGNSEADDATAFPAFSVTSVTSVTAAPAFCALRRFTGCALRRFTGCALRGFTGICPARITAGSPLPSGTSSTLSRSSPGAASPLAISSCGVAARPISKGIRSYSSTTWTDPSSASTDSVRTPSQALHAPLREKSCGDPEVSSGGHVDAGPECEGIPEFDGVRGHANRLNRRPILLGVRSRDERPRPSEGGQPTPPHAGV